MSCGQHVDAFDAPPAGHHRLERPRPAQLVGRDREVRRRHGPREHFEGVLAVRLDRHPDRDLRIIAVRVGQERQALGVVPVEVAVEDRAVQRMAIELDAEPAQAGAGVEHEPPPSVDGDGDARRVPADAGERCARRGGRPAHPTQQRSHGRCSGIVGHGTADSVTTDWRFQRQPVVIPAALAQATVNSWTMPSMKCGGPTPGGVLLSGPSICAITSGRGALGQEAGGDVAAGRQIGDAVGLGAGRAERGADERGLRHQLFLGKREQVDRACR